MTSIFISHSSSDLDEALEIREQLIGRGFQIWMAAEDIQPGVNFAEEITKSIHQSDAVVVLLSPESIASPHVKREVNLTIDRQKFLIPVLLGGSRDFIATLPEDWKYWLTVVQVLKYESGYAAAEEIAYTLEKKSEEVNKFKSAQKNLRMWKRFGGSSRKTKFLISIIVFSLLSLLMVGLTYVGSNNTQSKPPNTIDLKSSTSASKIIDAKESMMASDFSSEMPLFPSAVVDYELGNQVRQDQYAGFRLFYPDDWKTPSEFEGGTMVNGCEQTYWVMRWRSNNPDVVFSTTFGQIDGSGTYTGDAVATGGAGYISGFACDAPFFKFKKTINGNQSTLADINYEIEFWSYKPGI